MSENTKTFSPDLTRDTHTEPAPKAANQRQPTGLSPQALAILDHLNRHPDPSAALSQWQAQDPALYAEALRAISATQGNSAVNQRVDAGAAAAPADGPSRTERARRSWSAETSGKNKAAFASLFNALKPEAAAKPKLSEILTQSEPVPLPQRGRLEAALCRDLSGVRAYQGPEVNAVLSARQAKGAAIGQHVLLGPNPTLDTIAEEVIHTLQQSPISADDIARVDDLPSSQPSDASELEAKEITAQVVSGQTADPIQVRRGAHFAKQDAAGENNTKTGHWKVEEIFSFQRHPKGWELLIVLPEEFTELDPEHFDVVVAGQKMTNIEEVDVKGKLAIRGIIPASKLKIDEAGAYDDFDVKVQLATSAYIVSKGNVWSGEGPEILPKPVQICTWEPLISQADTARADDPLAGISVKINNMEDIAAYAETLTQRGNGPPVRVFLLGTEGHLDRDGSYYFPDLTIQHLGVKDARSFDPLTAGEGLRAVAVVLVSSEDPVCPQSLTAGQTVTHKIEIASAAPDTNFWEIGPVQAAVQSDVADSAQASKQTIASRDVLGATAGTGTTVVVASVLGITDKVELIAAIAKAMNGRESATFDPNELWGYDANILQFLLFYLQKNTENGPTNAQLKRLFLNIKRVHSESRRDGIPFPNVTPCITNDSNIETAEMHVYHKGGRCIAVTENIARIEARMRYLSVDPKHIGIKTAGDENGRGYDERPEKNESPGVNVPNDGIVLYHHGLQRVSKDLFKGKDYPDGFPEWDQADTLDKEDAVIAHEYIEMKTLSHSYALGNAMNYPSIRPGAKSLLEFQYIRDTQR